MQSLPHDLFFILDPDQRSALDASKDDKHVYIKGPDPDKRTQLIIHAILDNLYSGKTCLVNVSDSTETQIWHALEQLGLSDTGWHFKGGIKNGTIASLQLAKKKTVSGDGPELASLAIEKYEGWLRDIEARHRNMTRPVFGDMSWKNVLDRSIVHASDTFKSILDASISARDFELTQQEYWYVRGRIKNFQRLRVLRTPAFDILDNLADKTFTKPETSAAKDHISDLISQSITRGRDLLKAIGEIIQHYRRDLTGKEHTSLQALRHRIIALEEDIHEGKQRFGNDALLESTFADLTGRLKRSVSRRSQELYTHRNNLRNAFTQLAEAYCAFYLEHNQAPANKEFDITLEELPETLNQMYNQVEKWVIEVDSKATSQKRRLNARNISSGHALGQRIKEVEAQINEFVNWINESGWLRKRVEMNALSLEKCSDVIQGLVVRCLRMREAMTEFDAYYLWRSFWSQLDNNTQNVLKSLEVMDDSDQLAAFDSWYFDNILNQIPEAELVADSIQEEDIARRVHDVRALVVDRIRNRIQNTRNETLKEQRGKLKKLISSIASANAVVISEELKVLPAQMLSQLFPVVFCSAMHLRDYAYYFDTLIVENESGADFKSACAQSKRCMFFSSREQVPDDVKPSAYVVRSLRIPSVYQAANLYSAPGTEKLRICNELSAVINPYREELRAYNAKYIQLFSFMGPVIDSALLNLMAEPYKIIGEEGQITDDQFVEALLDVKKPIVVLTRDNIMGYSFQPAITWQVKVRDYLAQCGIPVLNTWSSNWKKNPVEEFQNLLNHVKSLSPVREETPPVHPERIKAAVGA